MIKRLVQDLSRFNKNIIILTSGSIISQGLILLASPVLTRLYDPDAFGILALFTSLSVIMGSLFTGKYEQAIFLPDSDKRAISLIYFCVLLSFLLSLGLFIVLLFTYGPIGSLFRMAHEHRVVLMLVPLMTFSIGLYSCLQLWFQRKEAYTVSSFNSVAQSVFIITANLLFAFIGIRFLGLIFGYLASILFSTLLLLVIFLKKKYFVLPDLKFSWNRSKSVAVEYKRFPQFVLWAELLVTLTQQIVPLVMIALYSQTIVGLFSFANRIMRTPSILVASSVWGVYRNEAVKLRNSNRPILPMYRQTLKKLALVGFSPFLLLMFFGPFLFRLIFGPEWLESGVYARILAVFLFTELIAFPLSSTFVICNRQRTYLFVQVMSITLCLTGLIVGKLLGGVILSIVLYSAFGIVSNLTSIFLSHRAASEFQVV